MPIIDDISYLLSLSEDKLEEVLLQDKYNKANLRELVKRLLDTTKQYRDLYFYEQKKRKEIESKLHEIERHLGLRS